MKSSYIKSCGITGFLFFTLLFFSLISQAQVGIGNTNPAASSMLDITSTEKGFLVPRMTTAQRIAIPTPANSLLVYDTNLESFFHFDATPGPGSWVKINSTANERNNYKLVKSVADLAPELTAGGNRYLLTPTTFYEINGTITLTAPIDLNNAYVSGLDANEDVLSFPGGTVFEGSTGGSIRNITIKGARAFNISGPGIATPTSLLIQNTIVDGMTTSVGSISGLGLYFGNIVQFMNNANGITYNNIGNLLLNNQAWMDTNNGIFERLTGSFGLVEKVSGFSTVDGSDVALDVSGNPAVGNGVMLGTVFSGTTSAPNGYIQKYTAGSYPGYNFTNAWSVNCPGIPREADDAATGDFYATASANTAFSGSGNTPNSRKKLNGITSSANLFRFDRGNPPENNRIYYRGNGTRFFQVVCSLSFEPEDISAYIFFIAVNGVM